jgi:hypothetical protein
LIGLGQPDRCLIIIAEPHINRRSKLIPTLLAEGHEVMASQHGLDSLATDVASVKACLVRVRSPAVLVGHSYGGTRIERFPFRARALDGNPSGPASKPKSYLRLGQSGRVASNQSVHGKLLPEQSPYIAKSTP